MRRSRQRKKSMGSRQTGAWNAGASCGPSYESFTIPTPGSFPSKAAPGNSVDSSMTGRKRPASEAENVPDTSSFGTLSPRVLVQRHDSDAGVACQQLLDEELSTARPLQQASGIGVKHLVIKLSGILPPAATSGECIPVKEDESVIDMVEAESQHQTHGSVWGNGTARAQTLQGNQLISSTKPDANTSSQTAKLLNQDRQFRGERQPSQQSADVQKEDDSGLAVQCGGNSGGSMGALPTIDESRSVLEVGNGHVRSGFGHDLPARSTASYPHLENPNWMLTVDGCRGCPASFSMGNQAVSGCNACAGTRFNAPYSFRAVSRAARYYVEPAPLSQMKALHGSRIEPPTCCQLMNIEGVRPLGMYTNVVEKGVEISPECVQGRNLVLPSRTGEGHQCGTHSVPGDGILVCPAPWLHKGSINSDPSPTRVSQQTSDSEGVNWAPQCQGEWLSKQHQRLEESDRREMPEPVFPPAHCNMISNHSSKLSADLNLDAQRQHEEQIAQEILLLSQKLANLQARYGARRAVHNNSKPAVLSCPQTPLLLETSRASQSDVKGSSLAPSISQSMMSEDTSKLRPATSSSSKVIQRLVGSRCELEKRKLGSRNCWTDRGVPSTAQYPSKGTDTGMTAALTRSKYFPSIKAVPGSHTSGNSITGTRANTVHGFTHGLNGSTPMQGRAPTSRQSVKAAKSSKKYRNFTSPFQKGQESLGVELVDECSYSDDMKEHWGIGGANVQGYPDGNKRFDWVKTFRFGGSGVRDSLGSTNFPGELQHKLVLQKEFTRKDAEAWLRNSSEHDYLDGDMNVPTSVSKFVQAGGVSPEHLDTCTRASANLDGSIESGSRPKRRTDCSIETRPGKSGKKTSYPEDMGGLDSRITHHLLKAGLRRVPSSFKTPGSGRVPNTARLQKKSFGARTPRKNGGKRLRRRSLFDLSQTVSSEHVSSGKKVGDRQEIGIPSLGSKQAQNIEREERVDTQRQDEVGDYEAEYQTFVENTEVRTNNSLDTEGCTSAHRKGPTSIGYSEEDEHKQSPSSISNQGKSKLSEAPVVSLTKSPQATKKTFIRCIELVVATKDKCQFSKINGRKASGNGYSYRRFDRSERPSGYGMEYHSRNHVSEGPACQNTQDAEEQTMRKQKDSSEICGYNMLSTEVILQRSPPSREVASDTADGIEETMVDSTGQANAQGEKEGDNVASRELPKRVNSMTCKRQEIHADVDNNTASAIDPDRSSFAVDQRLYLASILSKVLPNSKTSTVAEPLTELCARDRWEEFIDALEKERLELPKIKTSGSEIGVTCNNSPRDSGSVRRIAEQVKSLRSTKLDKPGTHASWMDRASTGKDQAAIEDVTMTKGEQWNKIQQKQAVVF